MICPTAFIPIVADISNEGYYRICGTACWCCTFVCQLQPAPHDRFSDIECSSPLSKRGVQFGWGNEKVRGVNIGGWLVLEPYVQDVQVLEFVTNWV